MGANTSAQIAPRHVTSRSRKHHDAGPAPVAAARVGRRRRRSWRRVADGAAFGHPG